MGCQSSSIRLSEEQYRPVQDPERHGAAAARGSGASCDSSQPAEGPRPPKAPGLFGDKFTCHSVREGCKSHSDMWRCTTICHADGGRRRFSTNRFSRNGSKGPVADYEEIMKFLLEVPLFARLPKGMPALVAKACALKVFPAGQVIIKQGDVGNEFFVIWSGRAQVLIANDDETKPKEVATLTSGDYFGEGALLRNEPRRATIKASAPLSALTISQEKFQELALHERLQFRRKAIWEGGPNRREVPVRPPTKKTAQEQNLIKNAIRKNKTLCGMVSLSNQRMQELADRFWRETVPANKELLTQGDPIADYFYIVQSGVFEVVEDGQKVFTARAGDSFGERALLYSMPRKNTVTSLEQSKVWVIDRGQFKNMLVQVSEDKLREYVTYLDDTRFLKHLLPDEKLAIARAMNQMNFKKGDAIFNQGEEGYQFYILYDGEVSVQRDGSEVMRMEAGKEDPPRGASGAGGHVGGEASVQSLGGEASVRSLGGTSGRSGVSRNSLALQLPRVRCVGERALLEPELRQASVVVVSDTARAMVLDRASVEALLGPLEGIFALPQWAQHLPVCLPCQDFARVRRAHQRTTKATEVRSLQQQGSTVSTALRRQSTQLGVQGLEARPDRILKANLVRIGFLGGGGFGTVELWEHKLTGQTYALKTLNKGHITREGMQQRVLTEKLVLNMVDSPFIVTLYETYNDPLNLFFLMEAALGGELHNTYKRKRLYGSVEHARYYAACVALAFWHLHDRFIIYRDLKPENLLLSALGHVKVADFGLSKLVMGKTFSICGSPDYFAPELVDQTGHTLALDWWQLGVLVYELLTGQPPFQAEHVTATYLKVMDGIDKVAFPSTVQGAAADLVRALLQRDPAERLPMLPGGAANLQGHGWYAGFDWRALEDLRLAPPFRPEVANARDLSNFPEEETALTKLPYEDDGSGWDDCFETA